MPCYDGKVHIETALGLFEAAEKLTEMKVQHHFLAIRSGALIDQVRNRLVHQFLHDTNDKVLIFIDNDVVFKWPILIRLLAFSQVYPIVSGVYPSKRDDAHFIVNWMDNKLNEHNLLPVHSLGIGFTAIQRQVFENIPAETYTDSKRRTGEEMKAFFKLHIEDGVYYGEDVFFFHSAVKAGYQPMVDPLIHLGHMGTKMYDARFMDAVPRILNTPMTSTFEEMWNGTSETLKEDK